MSIKTETQRHKSFIIKASLPLVVILAILKLTTDNFHTSFLVGYLLGCLFFIILCINIENLLGANSKKNLLMVLITNLKFIILILAFYLLKIAGFSLIEAVLGILLSHFLIFLSYITFFFTGKKKLRGV